MTNLTITAADVALVPIPGISYELFSGPCDEAITAGQYVRFNTSTGKITKGNASTVAEARDGGVALNSAAAGLVVEAVRFGYVDLGAAIDGLAYDADVYLSDTDGTLADSIGTVTKVVGTVVPGWGETTPDKLLRVDMAASPEVPDDSITKAKLAPGTGMKTKLINGGSAGNHTVTGIASGDEIIFVAHISTAASVATIADLTSEFSITGANTINNAAGTDTTSDQLWVFYNDLT